MFNTLRNQRRRLEGDCLTAVLLIKRAEVSPLSWGFLFSLRLETESAGDHTFDCFFLNSPRLGCDLRAGFSICSNVLLCWGFGVYTGDEQTRRRITINMAASNARDTRSRQFSVIVKHRLLKCQQASHCFG